ncbi:centrosomal protein of 170 kDa protein B isoform X2 [Megalops cyprinoides]|uniref:centrosomal protein of 170 kDa protein B isoform X2 n=1 Tax=Megalops cyprinoides TaxID=118141 RepID=UPI0018640864|nr:centrosomal protein of 170 kDa protein B isoform X2 [Megalops cyprinoides]
MSVTSWFLVSSSGTRHRLPREMIFVGREDCELMLQSRSVDKQHAVINYDPATDEHLVKDLGSLNGTFVNDLRIPDQTYITLKLSDVIRFGYDSHVYILERSQHKVPEEALKHEKYTSQLQMSMKASEGKRRDHSDEKTSSSDFHRSKLEKTERKPLTEAPVSRPTPLYGQPSWWGEDDVGNKGQSSEGRKPDESHSENLKESSRHDPEINGSISDYRDTQSKSIYGYRREPSYFEIPTKEFQLHSKSPETEVHEIPTKDTDTPPTPTPTLPTPPVVQSHASFTIEFDDCTPGKIKIKDHVTKFSFRQRKLPGKEMATTPTEVMSAESKVADWLAQSDVSMIRRKAPCEDVYSTKSDLPMHIKTLKGHHHEDGTQSDSEDPILKEKQSKSQPSILSKQCPPPELASPKPPSPPAREESLSCSPPQSQSKPDPRQAFIIEFFDDNPRKKRSQSFTQNSAHADSYSALRAKLEKRKSAAQAGERPPASLGYIPPTQQVTVPLKGPGPGQGAPQRASSLKREKTEERLGTPAARSSSCVTIRPFGSVGRRSKLAQDFAAEFLRDHGAAPAKEKTLPPPPIEGAPRSLPPGLARSPPPTSTPAQPASPAHLSTPPMAPLLPLGIRSMELKASKARNDEEDSLSDAGTYTIETEAQDKEVEEARNMIDQVFGVLESPEYTGVTAAAYRPVINDDRDEQASLRLSKGSSVDLKAAPVQGYNLAALSGAPSSPAQVRAIGPGPPGGPKWVSRWASLADSSGPVGGLFDIPPQQEASNRDGGIIHQTVVNRGLDSTESEGTQGSRTRRLLPQVPPTEKTEGPTPSIFIRHEPYTGFEAPEVMSGTPRQQETVQRLSVQDDLDPDSLSDASKSDDGSVVERSRRLHAGRGEKGGPAAKSTSFYIGSDEVLSKSPLAHTPVLSQAEREQDLPPKTSPTTVLIRHLSDHGPRKPVKPTSSAPSLHSRDKDPSAAVESSVSCGSFVRQESFTKDGPSSDVQVNRLPHISSHPALRDLDSGDMGGGDSSQDTQSFLKETENALAALEAKLQAQSQEQEQKQEGSSGPIEDSLSGDSDVDTSSTVSLVSNKNDAGTAPRKRSTAGDLQKEKSSSSSSIQDPCRQASARERLSEKRRTQGSDGGSRTQAHRFQLRRSTGNRGSLDFSDEAQGSGLPYWPDTASSDHEASSRPTTRRKLTVPLQKEDSGKASKNAVLQALTRSNSLSAPRPTRASMLRRARLGDASDNEAAEADRGSQGSDPSAPAKTPPDSKKLSRLDILALPRKRTGSFTTPSDTESSASRTGFSNRSSESGSSVRKSSIPDSKTALRRSSGVTGKQPITRARSSSAKYTSTTSSRRRQKGSDYTSTSDEEYDSNHSTPKHTPKRSHASAATQTPRPKTRSRESEDDDNGGDPFQNWSTHSAEIARLSQDLAKDLAILAREIHDVAGDGDPPNTSPPSVPSTPASTISAREELVQHIPEASLNYQKVPPGSAVAKDEDQSTNDQDPNSKRRVWNREEVIFDNLMLNPVSQLSHAIRENTEQLAEKMKVLFHNKTEVWEEIEAKINAENEVPILKTSNKEISSILKELRRVQKQLEVINTIIEPSGTLEVVGRAVPAGTHSSVKPRPSSKDGRPSPQAYGAPQHGGCPSTGPNAGSGSSANEHAKRVMVGPEGESFVV